MAETECIERIAKIIAAGFNERCPGVWPSFNDLPAIDKDDLRAVAAQVLAATDEELTREVERRREAEEKALDYQNVAAVQGTRIFRMRIALQMAAEFTMSSYSATANLLLKEWINSDEWGPIPWPNDAFVSRWLQSKGYSSQDGFIGMRATFELVNTPDHHTVSDQV